MITSVAPDRSTATIDDTIIVDISGTMPVIQRQWCFEAIDTCAFDWMRLAVAQGLVSHDAIAGPAGSTPQQVRITCQVAAKEDIPRFSQGEYGYGVWGDPRLPNNAVIIWDGLGTAPPPFGGRIFFKETVIHALGDIATVALGVQKDPWKLVELGRAMKLGVLETENFDTVNTPPDLLLPPDSRPTQADIKSVSTPSVADVYNAWFGVGRHIKQMHRDDFPPDSFTYIYWGKTVGLDGVPGMYNPDAPEVVGGGGMYESTYITVEDPVWSEDPREFMAEAFKDIYAAQGSYRFTNRTKLKADYHTVDRHFSVRLPLGTTGYSGVSSADITSGLIPPGVSSAYQDEVSFRTGLPHSKVTQHSVITVKPWIPNWKVGSKGNEDTYIYQTTVQLDIQQQTEVQTVTHSTSYEQGLATTIKLDEPPPGESVEDWLAGVGLGTIGSQITCTTLVNISLPIGSDDPFSADTVVQTELTFGNTLDGVTEVSPWLAGVPVIGSAFTFPLNIIVEWLAESRRGPGRLQTGVITVKGIDVGGVLNVDPIMGQAVAVSDPHEPADLDEEGTGYPTQPLTVQGA